MSVIDFMHGSSFANALNSIANTHLQGMDIAYRKKVFEIIEDFKRAVYERNLALDDRDNLIRDLDSRLYTGVGFIKLLEEEIQNLRAGIVTENRFSGNDQLRHRVRDELHSLAQKVDPDLAATGGRFSGNRIQNLRDVLHMRIDEFCEYGAEHGLLNPDLKVVYSDEVRKKIYEFVDKQKVAAGKAPDVNEVLLLQRVLNKNYDLAFDAQGKRPDDYAFKPVNLIAAVGFTVKQLCQFSGLDETPFVGHKYSDPEPIDYGRDKANDGAAALLQLDYMALEATADQTIRQSNLANKEELIAKANARHADRKARLSAKMAIVRFAEVQAELYAAAG